jgi:putative MATE family efflux protein
MSAAATPSSAALNPRTRVLLEAPIVPTLLHLAWPNVLVMLAQAASGLIETWFVGRLGTDALAGVALVFPGVMLMQMISAGSMGGGISSAIARALGGGRRADADALVLHAVAINGALGVICCVLVLAFGPSLYGAMGGEGASLDAALRYSNVIFAGAPLLWLMNALASVVRGTGNMLLPGMVICGGVLLLVPLSPCLIFGLGPFPALGVAGGAAALVAFYVGGTIVLASYVLSGRNVARLRLTRLQGRLFKEILRVGGVAALTSIQSNVTIALTTGLAGAFGPGAVAGYGTAARLEYLLVPLVFGLGGPLVALVGTNIGAGQRARALTIAWTGGAIAFALTETIGLVAAAWPLAWLRLFGTDPVMLASGAAYLRAVGPFYGCFGLGLALYFASQGAGRLLWPVIGGLLRMIVAAGGGALALTLGGSLHWVFAMLGAGLVCYGGVIAISIAAGTWCPRSGAPRTRTA